MYMYVECLTSSLTVIVNFAHDLTSTDSNAHGVFLGSACLF